MVSDRIPFGVMFRAALALGEVWVAHFFTLIKEVRL